MKEAGRNSNMELLRIVSMLMVLSVHYLLFGNVLSRSTVGGAAYYACWTVEAIGHISVDCYMLISGYFLSRKQFTSRRILSFYVQVLFYTLVLAAFCFASGIADLTPANLIQIIPVMGGRNWYVTAYFCLLFITPALNQLVHSMEKKKLEALLAAQFILLSVLHPVFFFTDTLSLEGGHSLLWYCFVYMLGAYYRRYEIRIDKKYYALMLVILILPLSKFAVDASDRMILRRLPEALYAINSFPVLITALLVFDFFVGLRIKSDRANQIICLFGKTSFAVFYLHTFTLFGEEIWTVLGCETYIDSSMQLLHMAGCVILIYLVCSAAELIRLRIFSLLRINEAVSALAKRIDAKVIPKAD